jgi:hypothetical protein
MLCEICTAQIISKGNARGAVDLDTKEASTFKRCTSANELGIVGELSVEIREKLDMLGISMMELLV